MVLKPIFGTILHLQPSFYANSEQLQETLNKQRYMYLACRSTVDAILAMSCKIYKLQTELKELKIFLDCIIPHARLIISDEIDVFFFFFFFFFY